MALTGCPTIRDLQVPPSVSLTVDKALDCGYVRQRLGGTMTPLRGKALQFVVSIPYGLQKVLETYGSEPPTYSLSIGALEVSVDVYGVVQLTYAGEPAHGPTMQLHAGADFDFTIDFGSPLAVRATALCTAGRAQWSVDFGPQQKAFDTSLDTSVPVSGLSAAGDEPALVLTRLAGITCSAPSSGTALITPSGWALNPVQKMVILCILALVLLVAVLFYFRKTIVRAAAWVWHAL